MNKRWIATLLAAVMLLVMTATGAAKAPAADAVQESETALAAPAEQTDAANNLVAAGGAQAQASENYELRPQPQAYSFNMVCPAQTSPLTLPSFTSGTVRAKATGAEVTNNLRYEWYAADRTGEATGSVLSTASSFSVGSDPAYNASQAGSHFYLEKVYVGNEEVGSQLFTAAVMSDSTALTVTATQNGSTLHDQLNIQDGPITLAADFNLQYRQNLTSAIRNITANTAAAYQSGDMNAGTATWYPKENISAQFSGGSNLTGVDLPGQGVTKPTLAIESITASAGYVDFYFVLSFPFRCTASALDGSTFAATGTVNVFTQTTRVYSGEPEPSASPTANPGGLPSDWTTELFRQEPLTQAQSIDLYKDLIGPYHDSSKPREPFALLAAQNGSDGLLTQSSQTQVFNLINFVRRSAGVDPIATIDPQFSIYSQAGTDFLSKNNLSIDHNAADGSGDANAINGLRNSNLSWIQYSSGIAASITEMQLGQLYDDDAGNVPRLGHRRWLLDNRLTKTGFGYTAPTSTNLGTYEATYVLDPALGYAQGRSLEAFPGVGAYPVELMKFRVWSLGVGQQGWTVDENALSVSITRARDGKTWELSPYTSGGYLSTEDWFDVNYDNRGAGPVIIFRPTSIYSDGNFQNPSQLIGDTFTIRITGIQDQNHNARTVVYGTQFYSLADTSANLPAQPTPTPTPTPTPPGPAATAQEPVVWWNIKSNSAPELEVSTAQAPARSYAWYALTSADQDPASGAALQGNASSYVVTDTSGWSGGQSHYYACVVSYANQQQNGAGETVVRFTVHAQDLPEEIAAAPGIDEITPVPSADPIVPEGGAAYLVKLSSEAFDDSNSEPSIELADGSPSTEWSMDAVSTNGEVAVGPPTSGPSAEIPDRAGLYYMRAKTGEKETLFVVAVEGSLTAPATGAKYDTVAGAYVLPAGRTETTIKAEWDTTNVSSPESTCVQYLWQLQNRASGRAVSPTLVPGGTSVEPVAGQENTWLASGAGADTAVLSGITAASDAIVTVTPYAPGTYGTDNPIRIGNVNTTTVKASSELPQLSYPNMTATAGQTQVVTARPTWNPSLSAGTQVAYKLAGSQGAPAVEIDENGVLTVAANQLRRAGVWNYTVTAELPGGIVSANVRLTIQASQPSASPTRRPTSTPTYLPTYNPTPSWTSFPTVAPSPSVTPTPSATPQPSPSIGPKPGAPFTVDVVPGTETGDRWLTGVPISTKNDVCDTEDLLAAIQVPKGSSVEIETPDGDPLPAEDPIATGCRVIVRNRTEEISFTVVVRGDVVGTGELNTSQLVRLAADLNNSRPLTGPYLMAGKILGSGEPNIADLVALARMLTDANDLN